MRMLSSRKWSAIYLLTVLSSGCCAATREPDRSTVPVAPLPPPCLPSPPPPSPDPMIFKNPATRADQLARRLEIMESYAARAWLLCGAR